MTTSYPRLTGLTCILFILLAAAPAHGLDLGARFGQDGFYVPLSDTTVRPVSFLAEAEFGLGRIAVLRAQAGYSYYEDLTFDVMSDNRWHEWIDGVRVQAAPLFPIRTPLDWLTLRGGIGLGVSWYEDDRRNLRYEPYGEEGYSTTRNLFAGTQTFIAGARCDVSSRLAVLVDLERAGLRMGYTDAVYYEAVRGYYNVQSHTGEFSANWDGRAREAVSAALHFKL